MWSDLRSLCLRVDASFNDFCSMLLCSKSSSTLKNYLRCFRSWLEFCAISSVAPVPVDSKLFSLFLMKKVQLLSSASSVVVYRAAISWFHGILTDSTLSPSPWVSAVCENARRALVFTGTRKAPACSVETVQRLLSPLLTSVSPCPRHLRIAVMILVAFHTAYRISDLLSLRRKHVFLCTDKVQLTLEKSKTDQFREGDRKSLPYSSSFFCPAKWLDLYVRSLPDHADFPLFPAFRSTTGNHSSRPMTYDSARKELNFALSLADISENLTWHSFRSGCASALISAGLSPREVMVHCRWKGPQTMERYLSRSDLEQCFPSRVLTDKLSSV